MRVLHITPYFYPAWVYGGVPRSLYELAREQVRQGDAVRVLTTDVLDEKRRNTGPTLRQVDGIEVRYLPNVSNRLAQRAQIYLPRSGWLAAAQWIDWAEALHFHCHRILFFHLLAPFFKGRSYVLTPRGSAGLHEGRFLRKRLYDLFLGDPFLFGASRVVALSALEEHSLAARGLPRDRLRVVPHGIDWEEEGPESGVRSPESGEASDLLYLGKVTPLKGIETLLGAIVLLKDVTLSLAGNDIGHTEAFRKKAADLGISGRVHFVGFLDGGEKRRMIRAARAVVCPSRFEAFGLVPLEALREGTPVATTRNAGCAEILEREGLVHAVDDQDPASLRDGILRALFDDRRGAELARLARDRLSPHFGWPAVAAAYREMYREASAGSGA